MMVGTPAFVVLALEVGLQFGAVLILLVLAALDWRVTAQLRAARSSPPGTHRVAPRRAAEPVPGASYQASPQQLAA